MDHGRLRRGKLVEAVVGHVPNLLNRLTCVLCSYLAVHLEGQLADLEQLLGMGELLGHGAHEQP